MIKLEPLAAQLFLEYSERITGQRANWQYLNKKRKLEWIEEVLMIAEKILEELNKNVKPLGNVGKPNTSYELGFQSAQKAERLAFTNLLRDAYSELLDQYIDFKEDK